MTGGQHHTVMIPAYHVADELKRLWTDFIYSPRGRWLTITSYRHQLTIDDTEWIRMQRAVICDGRIVGYLGASIDRDVRRVDQLVAANFIGGHTGFALALRAFVRELRSSFEVLHWSAVADAPSAAMYRRATRYGVRVVGVQRRAVRLTDGSLHDLELYEILGDGGRQP